MVKKKKSRKKTKSSTSNKDNKKGHRSLVSDKEYEEFKKKWSKEYGTDFITNSLAI